MESWLPAMPDVVSRLESGGRVADGGCGVGWSTVAIAKAYPGAEVFGFDLDEASIEAAKSNASEAGVDVSFEVRDAASPDLRDRFDLVCLLEALHDMSRPVDVLRTLRRLLTDGGVLLVADEKVADAFAPNGTRSSA